MITKNKNSYKNFLMCNECPIWKDEIKIWKNNPEYKIKIWNYPHKTMYLNKILIFFLILIKAKNILKISNSKFNLLSFL